MIKEEFHVMSLSLLPSMLGTFWSFQYTALHDLLLIYQMQAAKTQTLNAEMQCQLNNLFSYFDITY